jgi:putative peptide zinc metalloprotease protein
MKLSGDYRILELSRSRLQLRADLHFTPQFGGGDQVYLIEDRLNGKYYRIGYPEYVFISLLDGKTTIAEAMTQSARTLPGNALSEHEAMIIGEWLLANDLAHTSASSQAARPAESVEQLQAARVWQRWNPLMIRIPFGSPDRILEYAAPWLRWLYSLPAVLMLFLAVLAAGYVIISQTGRFADSAEGLFSPQRWLWLALCWLVLKILHETSHAMVCRLFGGTVRDTGILLILFTPVAYVDVTSSWRFRSKWHRIYTAAAGIYIELWVACLAAVAWGITALGPLNDVCYNLFFMAGVTTLIFNANFLMRFDGYYIFSDLVGMPNLSGLCQKYWSGWARRYLMGLPATAPVLPPSKMLLVRAYGLAAMAWRIAVCLTILVTAAAWFGDFGLLLVPLAMVAWWGRPLYGFLRLLVSGEKHAQPRRLRFYSIATATLVVMTLLLIFLPWPFPAEFPAIVEFTDRCVVRADSDGWVRQLFVKPGQKVLAGEVLLRMENAPLEKELADLKLEIEQSLTKSRMLEKKRELAAFQAELKNVEALQNRLRQKSEEVDKLIVRAPIAGEVIARELDSLRNTYLSAGQEICILGDEERKEIRASVNQNDLETANASLNQTVRILVFGSGRYSGTLSKISPRADKEPLHPALCAPEGGPLTVKSKSDRQKNARNSNAEYELLEPCFTATVKIRAEAMQNLYTGQRAAVAVPIHAQSFAEHLYFLASQWLRRTWQNSESKNTRIDRT